MDSVVVSDDELECLENVQPFMYEPDASSSDSDDEPDDIYERIKEDLGWYFILSKPGSLISKVTGVDVATVK
jgi:hypothetical protein